MQITHQYTNDIVFAKFRLHSDPALIILNKPLTLLFLIACRHPAMTCALPLPTIEEMKDN